MILLALRKLNLCQSLPQRYRCHYEPYSLEAIRRIREGALGEVRVIHTDNARPIDPSIPVPGSFIAAEHFKFS